MASIDPYLKLALEKNAKQLVLRPDEAPYLSTERSKIPLGEPINGKMILGALSEILSEESKSKLFSGSGVTAFYSAFGSKFKISARPAGDGAEVVFVNTTASEAGAAAHEEKGGEGLSEESDEAESEERISIDHSSLKTIDRYLLKMTDLNASDLHLCSGCRPYFRVDGDLAEVGKGKPFEKAELVKICFEIEAAQRLRTDFDEKGSCDFVYEIPGAARYRFNIYKDHKGVSASIRLIPSEILSAEKLNLSKPIQNLSQLPKGLVLVTGPTGSGKSTTLAAILDLVNRSRRDHIITIESPIEFVHKNKMCLIHQREVGNHTTGFKAALRDALREDPDIVLVGELRDLETMSTALETAGTGHLVFGTLHTTTATSTINRIIDIFPTEEQSQVRYMLAESLKAVIAQTLLKKIGGGRVAALEVLMGTASVANLIREEKTHQILNAMQTGRSLGMRLLTEELVNLVKSNTVEAQEAYLKAVDKDEFVRQLQAAGISFRPPADGIM